MIRKYLGQDLVGLKRPKTAKPWKIALPQQFEKVEVAGKHIFITLSGGQVIHNHMLMWGAWREGVEWHGPKQKRLHTAFVFKDGELGYFGGGILELMTSEEAAQRRRRLGPDLVDCRNPDDAFSRVISSKLPIGEALLNQELVAGIGNIYKSEGLFAARIHPRRRAAAVSADEYRQLFMFLKPQMKADERRTGPISTTPLNLRRQKIRNFAYRRYHQPCLFCGTKVERIYQQNRSTYFCPHCQPKGTR